MPCPACKEERPDTVWKPDPLQWDLDPPCSEVEWRYLQDLPQAPEVMHTQQCAYLNKICRACYSARLEIKLRLQQRIRDKGGIEEVQPSMRMRKDYEAAHEKDVVAGRGAKIEGLQSAAGSALNGLYCKLLAKDAESERWTVELVSGEQKSVKEANLRVSKDVDREYLMAQALQYRDAAEKGQALPEARPAAEQPARPLGQKTPWPKIKGVHPGAVVKLKGLQSAAELNGRTGRCVTFDAETGRWKVDLGDEFKSLKPDNFEPSPGAKPPTRESAEVERKEILGDLRRRQGMTAKQVFAEDYGWES